MPSADPAAWAATRRWGWCMTAWSTRHLLSLLDGVDALDNILVVGMTNRKDLIDPALLRPGRLEVDIRLKLPEAAARLQILRIHTRALTARLAPDVRLGRIAAATATFSGAHLSP
eukprot:scaffold17685_cov63-Phaeocystis_antarctica.AAC.2